MRGESGYCFWVALAAGDRHELEAASATELVTIYLESVSRKQYDKAVACLDNHFVSAADEAALVQITGISDIIIKPYTTEEVAGPSPFPTVDSTLHFDVTYKEATVRSPKGAVVTWFFQVDRDSENGRWRIIGIATGP